MAHLRAIRNGFAVSIKTCDVDPSELEEIEKMRELAQNKNGWLRIEVLRLREKDENDAAA